MFHSSSSRSSKSSLQYGGAGLFIRYGTPQYLIHDTHDSVLKHVGMKTSDLYSSSSHGGGGPLIVKNRYATGGGDTSHSMDGEASRVASAAHPFISPSMTSSSSDYFESGDSFVPASFKSSRKQKQQQQQQQKGDALFDRIMDEEDWESIVGKRKLVPRNLQHQQFAARAVGSGADHHLWSRVLSADEGTSNRDVQMMASMIQTWREKYGGAVGLGWHHQQSHQNAQLQVTPTMLDRRRKSKRGLVGMSSGLSFMADEYDELDEGEYSSVWGEMDTRRRIMDTAAMDGSMRQWTKGERIEQQRAFGGTHIADEIEVPSEWKPSGFQQQQQQQQQQQSTVGIHPSGSDSGVTFWDLMPAEERLKLQGRAQQARQLLETRFVTAGTKTEPENEQIEDVRKEEEEKEVEVKQLGQVHTAGSQRSVEDWCPEPLLCKRLDVLHPYPDRYQEMRKAAHQKRNQIHRQHEQKGDQIVREMMGRMADVENENTTAQLIDSKRDERREERSDDILIAADRPSMDVFRAVFSDDVGDYIEEKEAEEEPVKPECEDDVMVNMMGETNDEFGLLDMGRLMCRGTSQRSERATPAVSPSVSGIGSGSGTPQFKTSILDVSSAVPLRGSSGTSHLASATEKQADSLKGGDNVEREDCIKRGRKKEKRRKYRSDSSSSDNDGERRRRRRSRSRSSRKERKRRRRSKSSEREDIGRRSSSSRKRYESDYSSDRRRRRESRDKRKSK